MKVTWLLPALLAASAFTAWEFGCAEGTIAGISSDDADSGATSSDDDDGTVTSKKDSSVTVGDDDDDGSASDASTKTDSSAASDSGATCEGGICAPTAGLVAYYAFGGNANDSSPSKANGTPAGMITPTSDRFGRSSSAYLFNGGAASITAPNTKLPTGNASRTLAVWIYPTSTDTYNSAANWGSAGATGQRFGLSLKNGAAFFTAQKDDVAGSGSLANSKWHLLVATYDNTSNTLNLYVDGTKQATHVYAGGLSTTGDPLVIGQKVAPPSDENWWGMLDDVRVYDRVLSAAELDALLHENGY